MTIANERLVEYLGLELELCYVIASGEFVWILADKIRRKDQIAVEMLRIFNRFMRIGKSLDAVNKRPPPSLDGTSEASPATTTRGTNVPYARCIGVRVRLHDHVADVRLRSGVDAAQLANARRLSSGSLLDANLQLTLDDPILELLSKQPPASYYRVRSDDGSPKEPSGPGRKT
jgi:hypothetical protein